MFAGRTAPDYNFGVVYLKGKRPKIYHERNHAVSRTRRTVKIKLFQMAQVVVITPDQLTEIIQKAVGVMSAGEPDEIYTVSQAAKFLSVSPDVLRELSERGQIPCVDAGLGNVRHWRYSRKALEAWVRKDSAG